MANLKAKAIMNNERNRKQNMTSGAVQVLSQEEQMRLLQYTKKYDEEQNTQWYSFFLLMLATGLRVNEITGLQWDDVELNEETVTGTINVCHSLVFGWKWYGSEIGWSIYESRTGSRNRKIQLVEHAVKALLAQKRLNLSYIGEPVDGLSNFVFVNKQGHLLRREVINRTLRSIITAANNDAMERNEKGENTVIIRPISSHVLRRTFVKRCIEIGFDEVMIKNMAGLSNIQMSMYM